MIATFIALSSSEFFMPRLVPCLVLFGSLFVCDRPASAQFVAKYETVAVTEFMVHPGGPGYGRQWIELYNFGDTPVDLSNFRIDDEKNKIADIPKGVVIQPKDFIILVMGPYYHHHIGDGAELKQIFETEWLGGKSDPRVVGMKTHYVLGGADTLILRNLRRAPIWILGWRADDTVGHSTYLAIDNFSIRMYGTMEKPSINRSGPDGQTLGYESQYATKEPLAWTSDVSKLETIGGIDFKAAVAGGKAKPGIGSPLKGNYPGAKN
jgi:hypothetical protein